MTEVKKVLFVGSKKTGLEALKKMHSLSKETLVGIVTIDDREDMRTAFDEIINYCVDNSLLYYLVADRKEFNSLISKLRPDLCIVVCWYWVVPKKIFDMVPKGFVGVHYSPLPKYRGGSPLIWQIINGEKKAWISVFSFAEDMDAGDIWFQDWVDIKDTDYISDVVEKLDAKLLFWLDNSYLPILSGKVVPSPQVGESTYCAQRFPEDGEIDWTKSAKDIYNFIRAQSHPYPGAFTYLKRKKLTIWHASFGKKGHGLSLRDMVYYGTAGQVARVSIEGVYVICGDNRPLLVEYVQLEGDGPKLASDVLKSFRIRLGRNRNELE